MLLQAGSSGRGMAFAGRWAELVFAAYPSLDAGKKQYQHLRAAAEAAGRDPDSVKIAPAIGVTVAESADQAAEKRAFLESLARPIDGLTLLCEVLNVDFAARDYDEPFNDEELAAVSWHSYRDRVIARSGKTNPSVRDFVEISGRGTLNEGPRFVGSPTQIADQMEEWFGAACDGFVIAAACTPRVLRRLRPPRGPGTAAARPPPARVRRRDAARQPGTAPPGARRTPIPGG